MKSTLHPRTLLLLFLALTGVSQAQLKTGSNPTSVAATSNFEVEATNGNKFIIGKATGAMTFIDGNQGAGKVLVSDANGNATWTDPAVASAVTVTSSNPVNTYILGYTPSAVVTAATAPGTVTMGSVTFSKYATTVTYGGHSYAFYTGGAQVTWQEAYTASQNMGGYLATFTTRPEWIAIETVMGGTSAFDNLSCWIGMGRTNYHANGNFDDFQWITGEQLKPGWSYGPSGTNVPVFSNFSPGNPDNSNGVEGFVLTGPRSQSGTTTAFGVGTPHAWNDVPSNNVAGKGFIVEFQQ